MIADDPGACSCPFCDGRKVPKDIVEMVMASAGTQGRTMSKKEFLAWLASLDGEAPKAF
ncbi:hypothetical protein GCM10011349_47730 [Novosphingobium indicum]|uniref:Uncharacterized protein n=1 Tax=Novosphingobium indicum TaxID=462949 RepID=A0ABQ2K3F9_9SPHN|nr:hypothetical protein [Novosphingobium indicum]GGN63298.1 hypothetical protein GCM10011349_47730 [Novosphingobium indicum]